MYVWQQVKFVGFSTIKDINERYTVFCNVVDDFDYEKNNNFILYYKNALKYSNSYRNDTFFVTGNRTIIHNLRNENISPTDCEKSKLTSELKKWSN